MAIMITILFFFIGIYGILNMYRLKSVCTEFVDATVVELVKERHKSSRNGSVYYTDQPVFEYTYCGKTYNMKSEFYSTFCKYHKGDHVELFINPENPEEYYCVKEKKHIFTLYLFFLIVGIIALIAIAYHYS